MHTLLCLFQQRRRQPLRTVRTHHHPDHKPGKAQVLVIFAFAILALAAFVGLAIDAASLYLTHAQLKRAVDAAVVSASNDFKKGAQIQSMAEAAREALMLHNVDMDTVDLHVYDCDTPDLETVAPAFYAVCPDIGAGYSAQKLIYVQATQKAPLYFLQLMGFDQIPVTTYAIAEAASVDLVIVLDVSESMAKDTGDFVTFNYDPSACNADNSCQPMASAKAAAIQLVDSMYDGYDQVAVVTYDSQATIKTYLSSDLDAVKATINAIGVYDDPPIADIWPEWKYRGGAPFDGPVFNPINPDDRDGDGRDIDYEDLNCGYNPDQVGCCTADEIAAHWQDSALDDSLGYNGFPCDSDTELDAYSTIDEAAWLLNSDHHSLSINSTCTGCGIRYGSNLLKTDARPNSVWVMVLLTDGIANVTDTPATATTEVIPAGFPNGFCTGYLTSDNYENDSFWSYQGWCMDKTIAPNQRICIDIDADTCPPESTHEVANPNDNHYSVYDWTLDMIDEAALTHSENAHEPRGNDIAIYSIGLGSDVLVTFGGNKPGAALLRYAAAVGDDGDRTTDPCDGIDADQNCGQYYYAPNGAALAGIFDDIAGRIYTRISQ